MCAPTGSPAPVVEPLQRTPSLGTLTSASHYPVGAFVLGVGGLVTDCSRATRIIGKTAHLCGVDTGGNATYSVGVEVVYYRMSRVVGAGGCQQGAL